MFFTETKLKGVFTIDIKPFRDERGFFARSFDAREFTKRGLVSNFVQANVSLSKKKGTLRGLHFQKPPFEEVKLVYCTKGALFDVTLDLRVNSPTYKQHFGVKLSNQNRRFLYVPQGVAHGFITLADDTEVFYLISEHYHPDHSTGVRWNDEAFGINWPQKTKVISDKDKSYPDFKG